MKDLAPGPIAFFLPSLAGGGAERVVVNLAQGMTERGFPVDIVLAAAGGDLMDQVSPQVRLVDLRAGRVLRSLVPLARYIRRERPRVVVASISHANVVALWAAKLARRSTPVIVTVHTSLSRAGFKRSRLTHRFWLALMRTFYPWAASVVAVSRGVADDLAHMSGVPRERVQVVYNPIITPALIALSKEEPDHPWFAAGEPPVILGVGRLTPAKDFPNLVRAFAEVREGRAIRLMILGEGEGRSELTSLAEQLGVAKDVALPGYRDKAPAYMARSALFVLSSSWEGLPTVLLEALASGTRVVSTDCPSGPREILQGGKLASLVPVGDSNALAQAMIEALDRPSGAVSLEALAPFTQDASVNEYLRLIEIAG